MAEASGVLSSSPAPVAPAAVTNPRLLSPLMRSLPSHPVVSCTLAHDVNHRMNPGEAERE
ncbi:hypothetical protein GCM10027199_15860 [Amycolatopsis magusensis]